MVENVALLAGRQFEDIGGGLVHPIIPVLALDKDCVGVVLVDQGDHALPVATHSPRIAAANDSDAVANVVSNGGGAVVSVGV